MCGWSFIEAAAACLWMISHSTHDEELYATHDLGQQGEITVITLFMDDKVYSCHKVLEDERIAAEIEDLLNLFLKCFIGWYIVWLGNKIVIPDAARFPFILQFFLRQRTFFHWDCRSHSPTIHPPPCLTH